MKITNEFLKTEIIATLEKAWELLDPWRCADERIDDIIGTYKELGKSKKSAKNIIRCAIAALKEMNADEPDREITDLIDDLKYFKAVI